MREDIFEDSCLDCENQFKADGNDPLFGMKRNNGNYGTGDSYFGIYFLLASRETESFEFWRDHQSQGVRGIIDPLDPENPYGPSGYQDMIDLY